MALAGNQRRTWVLAVMSAAICWLVPLAGSASAASVVEPFFGGAKVVGDAGPNTVVLTASAGPSGFSQVYTIAEAGIATAGFAPGSSCRDDGDAVSCSFAAESPGSDAPSITVESGAGDDVISNSIFATIFTGPGDDTVFDSSADDSILGGPGDDLLMGAAGRDFLNGGPGADRLLGGAGIDRLRARDRQRDRLINCGPGNNRREEARTDRIDPSARSC